MFTFYIRQEYDSCVMVPGSWFNFSAVVRMSLTCSFLTNGERKESKKGRQNEQKRRKKPQRNEGEKKK